ncbi:hypothetical protein [Nocardioides sp.]|uniref:hypothetical protein n=1 Tax=Nocardioides sp. TaxID=35761 RepID=UPI0037846714
MTDDERDGGTDSWTSGGAAALATYAPGVLATYETLVSVRPSGVHDEMLESPDVVAFAEQFRADVSAIDDPLRAAFLRATGDRSTAVAQMVWISDVSPRLRAALDALFGPSDEWPGRRRYPVADTGVAIEAFLQSVTDRTEATREEPTDRPDAAGAALALADAMLRTPTAIPQAVVEAVHELLTPAEAVETVLDGACRSAGKIGVALAA